MTPPGVAYDRRVELQAFENTKAGVKGLVDAGITTIPAMFRHPLESLEGITTPSDNVAVIPTLDLSAARREDAVALVRHAAGTVGFFQVVNHGVPAELMAGMLAGVRRFNEGPAEAKRAAYTRDLARKVRFSSNFDLFQTAAASWRDTLFFGLAPDPPPSQELPEPLRNVVTDYGEAVTKVALCVLELLSESLGLSSDHLREMGCAHSLYVACQYYPPCPEPHLTLGHKRHTDEGFLTVLLPQVLVDRSGAGGTWVDVPYVPGALMINIGDLLQLVSNDQFRSAEHRVLANKSNDTARVSVASFFNTDMSSSTLYRPITNGHNPPIYRSVTAQEFMATFMSIGFDGRLLDYYRLEQDPPTPHV
ncbi:LOW QUALITY PROTEIN: DIBOA-glucoside dioxygenase BX6-like [Lolium rigidum]|uniref:LOW QUALITY PROTEIN: DIBOA-glucoside dioxygenase BX6-like n=1 Tax=Lolium rigidum TaxID=89674 RepID=UPI001F5DA3F4|nr:LOW QUALITY PROTEIN: DIBOA-glucoside dioxygenase BX6-like [Lolium rigidum]